jgi:hypothetical protein
VEFSKIFKKILDNNIPLWYIRIKHIPLGYTKRKGEMNMSKETIAFDPVVRPKNGQQFTAPRIPYWKSPKYKKAMQERKDVQK